MKHHLLYMLRENDGRASCGNPARLFIAFAITAVTFMALLGVPVTEAWEPKGNLECIAPANAGGGWDTVCRTTAGTLQKKGLIKSPMVVTNMPGGSGAVAIANVVTKRKADANLLVAASGALTFTISKKGTPYTYDDVIPLAQIAAEYGGFFVKVDSKYKTLADITAALKASPKAVSFAGGSAPGGQDHMKIARFGKAIGIDPTKMVYVPFQGGGEAMTSMLGGHVDVMAGDISEAAGQLEAKKIRCLGLMTEKRSTKFKEIPTMAEQGVKVSHPIWRGFYMAPGVPQDAVQFWSDTIRKMVESPEWAAERAKLGWEPTVRFGEDFRKFVKEETASYQALLKELGFLK